ncbi:MAG: hypothetical protein ACP5XB_24135 [Isosphaeraceae bacterium]
MISPTRGMWIAGVVLLSLMFVSQASSQTANLARLVGQPADIAPSAYSFRADRLPGKNPPESWILLSQYANLPFDKPIDPRSPALENVLRGLLWEEVRPVRQVELTWPASARSRPSADEIDLSYFDTNDSNAHTWWNPRTVKRAGPPKITPDGRTFVYAIPVDTWGVVASLRGTRRASTVDCPTIRALVPDTWKKLDLEIEWGFDKTTSALHFDGNLTAYDGIISEVRPLAGDDGTTMIGPSSWKSSRKNQGRRGVRLTTLYMGSSRWRRVWPYHAQADDVARTILTVQTRSGGFSFRVADLEQGPILASEFGFFVRAVGKPEGGTSASESDQADPSAPPFSQASRAGCASDFLAELSGQHRKSIRQRVREHPEQSWEGAVTALLGNEPLPPHPSPPSGPAMQVEVPSPRLTAQWKLGAWHILRRSVQDPAGKWHFNDFPYGILASETYMILRALDLQGMHREAADGLDQWLRLPMSPKIVPGAGGHHPWAKPDRPLGHFSDGNGCLTHAEGVPGAGGHMDGVHGMGPGAIMFPMIEHFRLTGDVAWLKAHAARLIANADWILRQRRVLAHNIPSGEKLWSKGLQPAHVVTPDSERMHMQYYETEAYDWLAVSGLAQALAAVDPAESVRLNAEAEAYRKNLLAAIDRSILLTPVVPVRDGTYRSFIPFAPYVRGFAAGAWGWKRCQGHIGAIYWDTVQSADPLISPAGLLSPTDRRVQGHLDVLEDRLLLENTKVNQRTKGYDPERDWFAHASWQYQCGLERHANIHLDADDAPNFLRSFLNQYAVEIMPGEYTFREHTTGGPPDKIYEESCFLERFRDMLVMEEGDVLWLARATPRAWLEQGKKITVRHAPTHFGVVSYEIASDVDFRTITATIELPSRKPPATVALRPRHPAKTSIATVVVNGKAWSGFDSQRELIRLHGQRGKITVRAQYR